MTREQFLDNWNNIDTIKDNKGNEFVINKTEAYANKEEFLNDVVEFGFIDTKVKIEDVKIGGINCYIAIDGFHYSIAKKHGKTDIEAYYIKL